MTHEMWGERKDVSLSSLKTFRKKKKCWLTDFLLLPQCLQDSSFSGHKSINTFGKGLTLSQQALVFTCLQKTHREKEKLLMTSNFSFSQCFLPIWRTIYHFQQIWNRLLQTLSVWNSLQFVTWERVNLPGCHICCNQNFDLVGFKSCKWCQSFLLSHHWMQYNAYEP